MEEDEQNANDTDTDTVEKTPLIRASTPLGLDETIDKIGFGRFHTKLFILCGLGNLVEAIEMSTLGILLPVLKEYWQLTDLHLAGLGSATFMGMLIGAIALGRVSDHYGRLPVFQISLLVSSLFGFASAVAPNIWLFLLFRFLLGIGYGGNIVTDVVLLAEFLPVKNRGVYLGALDLFFGIGSIMAVGMAWLIVPVPSLGWRAMIAFSAIPAFLLFFVRRGMPESPRYLLMNGRVVEARQVLVEVATHNGLSEAEVASIRQLNIDPPAHSLSDDPFHKFSALFHPYLRVLTIALIVVWFTQSFGGSLFLWLPLYLSEDARWKTPIISPSSLAGLTGSTHQLLSSAGGALSDWSSTAGSAAAALAQAAASATATAASATDSDIATSDRMNQAYEASLLGAIGDIVGALALVLFFVRYFDRRWVLRIGLLITAFACFALGIITKKSVVLTVLPFVAAVRSAVVALLYTFTPELYPTELRTTGLGVCSAFHRLAPALGHWVVAELYDISFKTVCNLFALIYVFSFLVTFALPYDTRDKPLASGFYEEKQKKEEKRSLCR